MLTLGSYDTSEGGGIGRRAGFRLQRPIPIAALSLRDIPHRLRPEEVSEGHQYAHFGHGDRNEGGVVPMDDVHRAAAALLHRAAEGGGIPLEVVRAFAELVVRSELVAGSRQVLDGPPELAARRAVELASVVLAVGARVDVDEDGRSSK